MSFRLGEWHCAACSFRLAEKKLTPEELAAQKAAISPALDTKGEINWKNTGSGWEREATSYGGGWKPPEPQTGRVALPSQAAPSLPTSGSPAVPAAASALGLLDTGGNPSSELARAMERHACYGLVALQLAVVVFVFFRGGLGWGLSALFAATVILGVLAIAMYSDALWAKWLCASVSLALWLAAGLVLFFMQGSYLYSQFQYMLFSTGEELARLGILGATVGLCIELWFLSILWRDIRELRT
jgi:hypothetical protein